MQMAEAFRQIVKRHDVGKPAVKKHPLNRHVCGGDDADGKAHPRLFGAPDVVGVKHARARPAGVSLKGPCVLVNNEREILPDGAQEIAGEAPEVSGAVKR